jgi:hypothetical protein
MSVTIIHKKSDHSPGIDNRVRRTNALQSLVVFFPERQWIGTQNIDVMTVPYKFVAESLDPHRHIQFTFRPQTTCAFPANSNAGMPRPLSGGRFAQTGDRFDKSGRVKVLGRIRCNIRSSLYGGFYIHAPFMQSLQETFAVRLHDPRDRRIAGAESVSNEMSEGIEKDVVVRTKKDFVATCDRALTEVQRTADESPARKNGINGRQQISLDLCLMNVALAAQAKSLLDDVGGRFLAHKQKSCVGSKPAYPPGGFQSVQPWQADIQQNQVRLQRFRLLNGLQSVRSFAHDLELGFPSKLPGEKFPEGFIVFD